MKPRICKYCDSTIPADRVAGTSAVCGNCGMNNEVEEPKSVISKYSKFVVPAIIVLGIGFVVNKYLLVSWTSAYAVGSMSLFETEIMRNKCIENKDNACVVAAYRRLLELEPNEPEHKANLNRWLESSAGK